MGKKINTRIMVTALVSIADEAIILIVVIVVLSLLGIHIPVWAIVILAMFLFAITIIIYRSLKKNPQLGFDNMVGLSGVAVEPVFRKGTVRINGELWFAASKGEKIEAGTEIIVVEQTGLRLKVVRKPTNSA